jgi:hypothetical protein
VARSACSPHTKRISVLFLEREERTFVMLDHPKELASAIAQIDH